MTVWLNHQCAAKGCVNTRDHGRFVGRFCGACDAALTSGKAEHGTSIVFTQLARIRELEAALQLRCPQCDMRLAERTALETPADLNLEPIGQCDNCGRKVWKAETIGQTDEMTQPSGRKCGGTFIRFANDRADRPTPPYPWCRQPSVCRGTCPLDPNCGE